MLVRTRIPVSFRGFMEILIFEVGSFSNIEKSCCFRWLYRVSLHSCAFYWSLEYLGHIQRPKSPDQDPRLLALWAAF